MLFYYINNYTKKLINCKLIVLILYVIGGEVLVRRFRQATDYERLAENVSAWFVGD